MRAVLAETFGSGNFGIGLVFGFGFGFAERDGDFAGVLVAFAEPEAALEEAETAFAFVARFFLAGPAAAFAFSAGGWKAFSLLQLAPNLRQTLLPFLDQCLHTGHCQ